MKHAGITIVSLWIDCMCTLLALFPCSPLLSSQVLSNDPNIQIWTDQLQSRKPAVVQDAAFQIAKHSSQFSNNRSVIISLGRILTDPHEPPQVREVAAFALGSIGPSAVEAVPSLVSALDDKDIKVERATVEALGLIGPTGHDHVEKIKIMMDQSDHIELRIACIEALARLLSAPEAINLLRSQMAYDNSDVKISCAEALIRLLPKQDSVLLLTTQVGSKDPKMQRAAAYRLAQFGPDAIDAAPALKLALASPEPAVRQVSAWALGLMGPGASRYAPALAALLDRDSAPAVQKVAADALGSIGSDDKPIIDALVRQLTNSSDFEVKSACATALGGIGNGPTVSSALFQALRVSADPSLQLAAASELAKMDPQPNSDIAALINVSKANNYHLREESIKAIGHIHQQGQIAIAPLMEDMLRDSQPTVRIAAAQALGEYAKYLSTDDSMASNVISALTSACANGKTHFAASQSIGEIALSLQEHFQASPKRQDEVLLIPLKKAAFDLEKDVNTRSDGVDAESLEHVTEALATLNRNLRLATLRDWLQHHLIVLYVVGLLCAYILWVVFVRFIALRYIPLRILDWSEVLSQLQIKIPEKWGGVQVRLRDLLLLNLFRHPMVFEAWIDKYADTALANFKDLDVCKARLTYFPLPLRWDNHTLSQLTPEHLRSKCQRERWCLRIIGEGGSGKTSLACQIALWALEAESVKRLCPDRRMIPVILERGTGPNILTDLSMFMAAIRGQVQNLVNEPDAVPEWLCDKLLRDRRVLVVIDGLSEMDSEPITPLALHPDFPVAALILTSRSHKLWVETVHADLEPLRIDSNHLLPFMNAYLGQAVEPLEDAELYDACRRLADLVGSHRSITPLLAKLYAEQLAKNYSAKTVKKQLPENIPDLILGYLNTINRDRGPADPDHALIHYAAEIVAWECCRDDFYAGYARKTRVLKALSEEGIQENIAEYLERRLQLVCSIPPAETHIKFALDPLAEYLAGLRLLVLLRTDRDWKRFLTKVDDLATEREVTKDFLLAVWDCCVHAGSDLKISNNIIEAIYDRVRVDGAGEGRSV